METVYNIWKKDTAPYYEVVVVCDTCYQKVAKCECEDEQRDPLDEVQCNEL